MSISQKFDPPQQYDNPTPNQIASRLVKGQTNYFSWK